MAKRILRLSASPHAVAAGVAAGVFTSFTPFMGLHFIVAFLLAYILRGNMAAAALGTFFGNPISFPFIWASTLSLGEAIIGAETGAKHIKLTEVFDGITMSNCWHILGDLWEPIIKPMAVGGVPLGIIFGSVFYGLTRWGLSWFQERRQRRMNRRRKQLEQL